MTWLLVLTTASVQVAIYLIGRAVGKSVATNQIMAVMAKEHNNLEALAEYNLAARITRTYCQGINHAIDSRERKISYYLRGIMLDYEMKHPVSQEKQCDS